jgi:hypothetical protein
MQQRANWNPVIVSSADSGTEGALLSASEASSPLPDCQHQRRSDLHFSMGVGIALALPAVIALGFYEVAEAIMLRG